MTVDPTTLDTRAHYAGPLSGSCRPTLADIVIATLKASGVRRIYGLPGDSLNGLTDALHREGDVTWHHVRHEESAARRTTVTPRIHGCAVPEPITVTSHPSGKRTSP